MNEEIVGEEAKTLDLRLDVSLLDKRLLDKWIHCAGSNNNMHCDVLIDGKWIQIEEYLK